jgi:hypothetical protein
MIQHSMPRSINGATATGSGGAKCAATPSSLIGKSVKSVGKDRIKVNGDDVMGILITFTDGTQAMACYLQSGMATTIKGGGLIQVEPNGCQYTLS